MAFVHGGLQFSKKSEMMTTAEARIEIWLPDTSNLFSGTRLKEGNQMQNNQRSTSDDTQKICNKQKLSNECE